MGGNGLPIARLFGIEIRVSFTWAILVAIVTLLGAQQAALTAPGLAAPVQWLIGVAIAVGFLVSVVAHELAHALVGRRYGVESTTIVLGFVGGLAPLSIQAPTPRNELAIALAGPLLLAGAGRDHAGASACSTRSWRRDWVRSPGASSCSGRSTSSSRASACCPGCRSTAAGSSGRSPGRARKDRDRAGAVTARVGRLLGFTVIGVGIAMALADLATEGLLVIALGWLLTTGARTLDRRLALERLLRGVTVARGDGGRPAVGRRRT